MKPAITWLSCALFSLAASAWPVCAEQALNTGERVVPVTEEPLHIVRYRSERFMIYTNWIAPGVSTLYHRHQDDLLAVIVLDTTVTSQAAGDPPMTRKAAAGSVAFFPYADSPTPYVHRVGALGDGPFVNIGLDFRSPLESACDSNAVPWDRAQAEVIASNRRGQAYRLTLPAGAGVTLPADGSGLLLVPLGPADLRIDAEAWQTSVGDFRLYEADRPSRLSNSGSEPAALVLFDAC